MNEAISAGKPVSQPSSFTEIIIEDIKQEDVEKMADECAEILVIEDGYPIVEELLKGYLGRGLKVLGRLDGTLPRDGELNPNLVAVALGKPDTYGLPVPDLVVGRPPSLCSGCPHIDSYFALSETLSNLSNGRVFSDIGCYTLGALKPYEAINSCVDMGASITMAKGAADAGSPNTPSLPAISLYAASISSSVTLSMMPPDSSLAATALFQLAGLPIFMAVAIVSGFFMTWPFTIGAAPSAWNPTILGRSFIFPTLLYSL